LEFNHDFDWDNPLILDREKHYYKRLISETINIKQQKENQFPINLQSDIECVHYAYSDILNKIKSQ